MDTLYSLRNRSLFPLLTASCCCSVTKSCLILCDPMDYSQTSLSFTISQSLLKLMSTESLMSSNHLIFSHPLLLLPSVFPNIRVFSDGWLFASGGQSIRASASVLPRNIQGWFPLELTGLISLQSKGLLRVFSSIIIQKHQFLRAQPSYSPTFISIHEFCKNYSFDCANICQQRDVSAF